MVSKEHLAHSLKLHHSPCGTNLSPLLGYDLVTRFHVKVNISSFSPDQHIQSSFQFYGTHSPVKCLVLASMRTHAINLAFVTELVSVKNMPTVKLFWRNNQNLARIERIRPVQQSGFVIVKSAMVKPSCETSLADQVHELPLRNDFSVYTSKDDLISTRLKVDHGDAKSSSWAISFCDHLEEKMMSWALRADTWKKEECYLLCDNYAPVEEMPPTTDLTITGTIPACLNGIFLRNGPNPKFKPIRGYHWFDGDGMIHGLNINDGKVIYVARYVQTSKLQQEEHYGASKFLKVGDLKGIPGYLIAAVEFVRKILGVLDGSNGVGTGNTSLVFHNNKLLALHEQDRPYSIKVLENGDLQTIGLEDYEQKLKHPVTAHPKIDPITGEMFIFTYQMLAPHLIYRVISKDGIVREPVPITLPSPVMMHDFAISENYAIFLKPPLFLNPMGLATGDFVLKFDPRKKSQLGLLPRNATNGSQIRWFEIPSCFISHTLNAWEEGDEVILIGCRRNNIDLNPDPLFKIERAWFVGTKLYEFRMNLKTGAVKLRQLSNLSTEFPRINPEYTGRKISYAYCAVFDETDKAIGVAKYDLRMEPLPNASGDLTAGGNLAGVFQYGPGRTGSEAIFVPCRPGMDGPEDDGYLIAFVHDKNTETSEAVIIDAKTMAPEPVAVVKLPRRVPHGFHAHFVSQEQLRHQA